MIHIKTRHSAQFGATSKNLININMNAKKNLLELENVITKLSTLTNLSEQIQGKAHTFLDV